MRASAIAGLVAGVWVSLAAAGEPPPLPKPAPQLRRAPTRDGAARQNRACETCHAEIAREWRGSRHRAAHDNAELSRALKREPRQQRSFCVRCHAPEAPLDGAPSKATAIGVGCVTCHVPLGPVLAAPRSPDPAPRRAPHALLRTAALENGDACASCHEFAFPPGDGRGWMQRTLSEHRVAAGPDMGCNGCHMPYVGEGRQRHRSHAFRGGHDPAFVRSALAVTATRPEPARVRIVLTPRNVTHAVPTGDLFRRLTVTATAPDGTRRVRHLARHFRPGGRSRDEIGDDRPYRVPSIVELWLSDGAAGQRVRWSVSYERVAYLPGGDESRAVLDGTVLVADGTLAPE